MKKVYIIDDDRNIVESIKIILESEDYEVASQFDEIDVVKNIISYQPDIIILDVMFPEDDSAGFKIAREIKNDQKTQKIPVLMFSAINKKGIYAGTFSNKDIDNSYLPINEFVEKPITPEQILEKIRDLTS